MRTTMIVKMIIHAPAGTTVLFVYRRDFPQIAEVVVSQQNRNILQDLPVLQSLYLCIAIPVFLYFLVYGENLRRMVQIVFP